MSSIIKAHKPAKTATPHPTESQTHWTKVRSNSTHLKTNIKPWSQGLCQEVHEDVKATLRDGDPSYSMVKEWDAEFKHGIKEWLHKGGCSFSHPVLTSKLQLHETEILQKLLTSNFLHNHLKELNCACVTQELQNSSLYASLHDHINHSPKRVWRKVAYTLALWQQKYNFPSAS